MVRISGEMARSEKELLFVYILIHTFLPQGTLPFSAVFIKSKHKKKFFSCKQEYRD
jgi:hypothetical protein